jgi:FKBP12-rapamycin complex-associated protein
LKENKPSVVYACLKHQWVQGNKENAYIQMKDLVKYLIDGMNIGTIGDISSWIESHRNDSDGMSNIKLLARCYLKLGQWQKNINENFTDVLPEILRSFLAATCCDRDWYKAWHAWALANFEAISSFDKSNEHISNQHLLSYAIPSIQGSPFQLI